MHMLLQRTYTVQAWELRVICPVSPGTKEHDKTGACAPPWPTVLLFCRALLNGSGRGHCWHCHESTHQDIYLWSPSSWASWTTSGRRGVYSLQGRTNVRFPRLELQARLREASGITWQALWENCALRNRERSTLEKSGQDGRGNFRYSRCTRYKNLMISTTCIGHQRNRLM
jgi:hypothetical protein